MVVWTLAGWLLWSVVVLVLRNRIHLRSTGRSAIFVRETSRMGARVRFAGLLLVLGKALVPGTMLAVGCGWPLWWDSSAPVARAAAFAVFAVGLAGTFGCQLAMRASWRIGIDHASRTELVTDGPFRYSRNPIYAFVILSAAALFLALPCVWSLAAVVLVGIGFALHVRWAEEPFLRERYGEQYTRWAAQVGRFLPWFGRQRE